MAFIWTEDMVTGNSTIDNQHKQCFNYANDLLNACKSGQGHARLNSTMQFFVDYTNKHFVDEEKLQQQYHYPDYTNHKKLHDSFKITMDDLAKKVNSEGATPTISAKITSIIGDWLINHILNEDKKVAAHING